MSKLDLKSRTIYAKLNIDKETGKKKVYFGGTWGSLAADERGVNATAIKTGDGLVVVDIDTKKLSEIEKVLRSHLEKLTPSVETARGYHYYFMDDRSSDFVNKAAYTEHVDVRSDGGVVFNKYTGNESAISYKVVGGINKKIPKKLRKHLLSLMATRQTKVKQREQWSEIESGGIHDGTLAYAMRDFRHGLPYDEVISRGLEYVENYLGGDKREIGLMLARIKWGFNKKVEEDLDIVEDDRKRGVSDIVGENLDDEGIISLLVEANKESPLALEQTMKSIKKKTGISVATLKEMLKRAPRSDSGVSEYFKGDLIWDSNLGVYVEVRKKSILYYNKGGFTQTLMSKSGWMGPSDVTDQLHTIPHKFLIYDPSREHGICEDKNGDDAINVFQRQTFEGKGKKIPKIIDKVLDNLFLDEPAAKKVFINWMATIIQKNIRTGVAWGFFGASGTGKGLISDIMRSLVGPSNASTNVGDTDLQSAFNPYAHHKVFIHLNEVASDFHGRHGVAGKLKALIGDPVIRINQKGMPEIEIDNFCNVLLNSNKPNPIELDTDDRRWNMIITNNALTKTDWWKGDDSYKKAMSKVGEFGAYLMNYSIDESSARVPMVMSKAKQSVINQTVSPMNLLGNAIKNGSFDEILEILDMDSDTIDISISEIKTACEIGFWSYQLLKECYKKMKGSDIVRPMDASRFLITPYISKDTTVRKINSSSIRGVKV